MLSTLLSALWLGQASAAQVPSFAAPLFDSKLDGALVSAYVTDLGGNVLFERNSSTRLMPASNQKLLSSCFALAMRPRPDQSYSPTRFWVQGKSLWIDCPGAPMVTVADLLKVKSTLGLSGLKRIYLRQGYAPGWCDSWQIGDAPNRYAPLITGFTVDRGGCEAKQVKGRILFASSEPTYNFSIKSSQKTSTDPTKAPTFDYDPFRGRFTLTGVYLKDRSIDTISLPDPVRAALEILGGKSATLVSTETMPNRQPDFALENVTPETLLQACLPSSDNFLAESLLQLGAADKGPGTGSSFSGAAKRMQEWLVTEIGLEAKDLRVADGSGLSRKNNVTTRAIGKLLLWARNQPTWSLYKSTLAISGKGTLANRLTKVNFVGKSGTLDMVVALSGIVQCSNGKERVISVILNHFGCSSNEARSLVDKFYENVSAADL